MKEPREAGAWGRIATLLAAAVRAPSGDNTQPWRFTVACDMGAIDLEVDRSSDPSPMNAGQRMARIAVGAAVENILRTARHNDWDAAVAPESDPDVVRIRSEHREGPPGSEPPVLAARCTNRRLYDGRPAPRDLMAHVCLRTSELGEVRTCWITSRERLNVAASLVGEADALMFGAARMRQAFLSQVRFDQAPDARVAHGLSVASLELSATDRLALRALCWTPQWVVKASGLQRVFAQKARQLVGSASGLCLVVAPDTRPTTDLVVGQAVQRAWLALTEQGCAVQPMMSWLVLENVWDHQASEVLAALDPLRLRRLRDDFREAFPEIGDRHGPAFLFRFGYADAPSGRTGRLHAGARIRPVDRPVHVE